MGITTDEAGEVESYFTDGITSETVDSFIANAFPGADPKPIKEYYSIEHYQGILSILNHLLSSTSSIFFPKLHCLVLTEAPKPYTAQLINIASDFEYTCPAHQRMAARANNADSSTYFYWWGVTPSCPPESTYLGPTHSTDLWFTFAITSGFTTSATSSGTCDFTEVRG